MRSGISLFDKGICKNLLKRCWPLWAAYLLLLLMLLPVNLLSSTLSGPDRMYLNQKILSSALTLISVSLVVSCLSALAAFGFLYNQKSCGLICSLPLRRGTVFITSAFTGLAPLLLADVLAWGLAALLMAGDAYVQPGYLGQWLGIVAMANVSFYGIAVFCAMLTGSVLIMPAAYLILNLAAYAAEGAVRALLGVFLYGYCYGDSSFTWLSPIINLNKMSVKGQFEIVQNRSIPLSFHVERVDLLAIYCVAGIVLLGLALLLYRRRSMETAGDAVALSCLKPVFKYCMTFGGAVVFACCFNEWVLGDALTGGRAALVAGAAMLVGAVIGYYAAEMLMQKTLDVFRRGYKGLAVSCCLLLLFAAASEFDLLGYERTTPQPEQVERIELASFNGSITQPENISAFVDLHKQIIAHKAENESAESSCWFIADYYTKDGGHLVRMYQLNSGEEALSDPQSDLMRWQDICNSQEVTALRTGFKMPVSAETLGMCNVSCYTDKEDGLYRNRNIALTAEQTLELYEDCILPDIRDGRLGRYWVVQTEDYYQLKSNTSVYIELVNRDYKEGDEGSKYEDLEFKVQMDSQRCLDWLKENLDLEPEPLSVSRDAENGEY